MKLFKGVIMTFISAIFILSMNINIASATEGNEVEIKINYGLENIVRQMSPVPIEVQVNNKVEEVLKGNIEIIVANAAGTKSSVNEKIEVEKNTQETFYIPVDIGNYNEKVTVKLYSQEKVIDTKEIIINKDAMVVIPELLVGVISDSDGSLDYLNDFGDESKYAFDRNVWVKRTRVADITPKILESNIKNLKLLDLIIINSFDTSKLSSKAIDNLNKWVENGGTLILGGTENTVNNISKSILDQSIKNYKDKWIQVDNEKGLTLNLGSFTSNNYNENLKYGTTVLAQKYSKSNGRVIVTSFDLSSDTFKKCEFKNEIIIDILKQKDRRFAAAEVHTISGSLDRLDDVIDTIPFTKEFPIKTIVIIFIIYVLAIGFGGYFILKKLDKREWLWVIIPILSMIFTVSIKNVTDRTSISDMTQIEINKVNIDEYGNGKIESYLSVANKYKKDLNINEPSGVIMEYVDPVRLSDQHLGKSPDTITSKVIYDGLNTKYEFNNVSALEFKYFNIRGKQGKFNKVDGILNFKDKSITGTVRNNLGTDIINSYIILGQMLWEVGPINKGETLDLNSIMPKYEAGIQGILYDENYKLKYKENAVEKNKVNEGIKRMSGILEFATKGLNPKEFSIISITEDSIDYGLTFNSDNIKKVSNTVYINPLKLDFTNSEGQIVYPSQMIDTNTISKSDTVFDNIDSIAGKGEKVVGYTIPEGLEAKEIQVYTSNIPLEINKNFVGEEYIYDNGAQIYNFETEEFEEIILIKGEKIAIKYMDKYVNDGIFKIKYFGDNEGTVRLPEVSIIGRYKNANNQ